MELRLSKLATMLPDMQVVREVGEIVDIVANLIVATGPRGKIGDEVVINGSLKATILGYKDGNVLMMPLGTVSGLKSGLKVESSTLGGRQKVGPRLLGRVVNAMGEPIDGRGGLILEHGRSLEATPPNPIMRRMIDTPFVTGVRSIDGLLTMGVGQRVAIMAGSGVGKSTLLSMIAKYSESDINVIALIGERGREVREFIEHNLGEEGLKKSVLVVATGDESPLLRVRASLLAMTIAEFFRDCGKRVVLMMDSITRLAMAQREIGLNLGEPPSSKGYTPSVFSLLPRLLERAGLDRGGGSITGIFTVLVEGDDMNEPIADTVRGIVDGHVVLSRKLGSKGHFPAIDILSSVSRVMTSIMPSEAVDVANVFRELLAVYQTNEDLINIGAYQAGSNPILDKAIARHDQILGFLRQKSSEPTEFEGTWKQISRLVMG